MDCLESLDSAEVVKLGSEGNLPALDFSSLPAWVPEAVIVVWLDWAPRRSVSNADNVGRLAIENKWENGTLT